MRLERAAMGFFEEVLNLLFPPRCAFCGGLLDRPGICGRCQADLPWTDTAGGRRTLSGGWPCAAPLWYEGAAREGLLRLKFQGAQSAAGPIGALMAQCAAERFGGEFDAVTWTPVSRKRLRQRGYDQTELLAQAACRLWDTRPERLLRKVRDNPAQSSLEGAEARRKNVRDAYQGAEAARGRRILLLDDICTTGSTLSAAAQALEEAGAAGVLCVTAALTREYAGPAEKDHPLERS